MTPQPRSAKRAIVVAVGTDKADRILELVRSALEASGDPHRPSVIDWPPHQSSVVLSRRRLLPATEATPPPAST